jgi:hypothetical protein
MFQIEIHIDDIAFSERMEKIWVWLNQRRFEPTTFRYEFSPHGIICRVDFSIETEAAAFAIAFEGKRFEPIR